MIGIYKITSPNNRVYIGQSINIPLRFKYYKSLQNKKQPKLYRSFLKYGVESHVFEIIELCTEDSLNERERFYQEKFNVLEGGLNCVLVNSINKVGQMSLESKNLMSKNHKKIWLGKKHSKETKQKMSESLLKKHQENRGFNIPPKRKKRTGNGRFGFKHSEEIIQKMIESNKRLSSKIILDLNTGVFYDSVKDCAKYNNMSKSSLTKNLQGKVKKSRIKNIIYA